MEDRVKQILLKENLTEEQQQKYGESMETVGGFLKDPYLVKLFRQCFDGTYVDGAPEDGPEATIKRSLSSANLSCAIQYLHFMQAAQVFIDNPELIDKYLSKFLNEIDVYFKTDAQKEKGEKLFINIKNDYGVKLSEQDSYKMFKKVFSSLNNS